MVSFCNTVLCAPTAAPAAIPASGRAILRYSFLIRCKPQLSCRADYYLCAKKASAAEAYVYPDPDPVFAASETRKFKAELLIALSKDEGTFGYDLPRVVDVCAEVIGILSLSLFIWYRIPVVYVGDWLGREMLVV
ncbi:hypothetical protein F511_12156 [Dorcoceras hygrometricum]|uniref:Uncharacterized protein n=1 Tax=Dorcoceras hygrometricum TaxID=472368 RepID=A0A2Z7AX91_9LAMI|nr:hypothetical protein F511_12156 [Dorcoceras hygrometricum]